MDIECQGCLYTLCSFICLTEDLSEILQFLWRHGCLRRVYFCEKCGRKCAIGDKDLFFRCNRNTIEVPPRGNQNRLELRAISSESPLEKTRDTSGALQGDNRLFTNSHNESMQAYIPSQMCPRIPIKSDGNHLGDQRNEASLIASWNTLDGSRTVDVLALVNSDRNCNLVPVNNIDDNEQDGERILTQLGQGGVHSLLRQPALNSVHSQTSETSEMKSEEPPMKVKRDKIEPKSPRKRCNFKVSMKKGTFFEKSKLPIDTVCKFVVFWCCMKNPTQEFLRNELSLATRTVVDWSNCCRDICIHWAKSVSEKIGGDGIIVQVDEVKVNDVRPQDNGNKFSFWGMEKDKEKGKVFIVPVPACDAWSLLTVINDWVLPGSVVISNCWKSYDCLKQQEFIQQTVVHSKTFIHPQNNIGQQNFDGKVDEAGASAGGDMQMPRFGTRRSHHLGDLAEFMFKRRYNNHLERIHSFFRQISFAYPLRFK